MSEKRKNPAAVLLGRKGGKAGTGAAKARSSAVARAAALKGWAQRRLLPRPAETTAMASEVTPSGKWGQRPFYPAKVGTIPATVLIRRTRTFRVDQEVSFCKLEEVRGMSTGCTPQWHRGRIRQIGESGMLFIDWI